MHVSLVIKNFKIHELENQAQKPLRKKNLMHQKLSFEIRDLNFRSRIFESRMSILGFRI